MFLFCNEDKKKKERLNENANPPAMLGRIE